MSVSNRILKTVLIIAFVLLTSLVFAVTLTKQDLTPNKIIAAGSFLPFNALPDNCDKILLVSATLITPTEASDLKNPGVTTGKSASGFVVSGFIPTDNKKEFRCLGPRETPTIQAGTSSSDSPLPFRRINFISSLAKQVKVIGVIGAVSVVCERYSQRSKLEQTYTLSGEPFLCEIEIPQPRSADKGLHFATTETELRVAEAAELKPVNFYYAGAGTRLTETWEKQDYWFEIVAGAKLKLRKLGIAGPLLSDLILYKHFVLIVGDVGTGNHRWACVAPQEGNYLIATFDKQIRDTANFVVKPADFVDTAVGGLCNDGAVAFLGSTGVLQSYKHPNGYRFQRFPNPTDQKNPNKFTIEIKDGTTQTLFSFVSHDGEVSVKDFVTQTADAFVTKREDARRANNLRARAIVYGGVADNYLNTHKKQDAVMWFRDELVQQDLVDLFVIPVDPSNKIFGTPKQSTRTKDPSYDADNAAYQVDSANGFTLCYRVNADIAKTPNAEPVVRQNNREVSPSNTITIEKSDGKLSSQCDDAVKKHQDAALKNFSMVQGKFVGRKVTSKRPGVFTFSLSNELKPDLKTVLETEAKENPGRVKAEFAKEMRKVLVNVVFEKEARAKKERVLILINPLADGEGSPSVTLYATQAFKSKLASSGFKLDAQGKVEFYVPELDPTNPLYTGFVGYDYREASKVGLKGWWGAPASDEALLKEPRIFAPIREYEKVCGLGANVVEFFKCDNGEWKKITPPSVTREEDRKKLEAPFRDIKLATEAERKQIVGVQPELRKCTGAKKVYVNYIEDQGLYKLVRFKRLWKNVFDPKTFATKLDSLFSKHASNGQIKASLKDLDSLRVASYSFKRSTPIGKALADAGEQVAVLAGARHEDQTELSFAVAKDCRKKPCSMTSETGITFTKTYLSKPQAIQSFDDVAAVIELSVPLKEGLRLSGYYEREGSESLQSGFLTQMDCVYNKEVTDPATGAKYLRKEPLTKSGCINLPMHDAKNALTANSQRKHGLDIIDACRRLVDYYNQDFSTQRGSGPTNKIILNALDISKKYLYDVNLCKNKEGCKATALKVKDLIAPDAVSSGLSASSPGVVRAGVAAVPTAVPGPAAPGAVGPAISSGTAVGPAPGARGSPAQVATAGAPQPVETARFRAVTHRGLSVPPRRLAGRKSGSSTRGGSLTLAIRTQYLSRSIDFDGLKTNALGTRLIAPSYAPGYSLSDPLYAMTTFPGVIPPLGLFGPAPGLAYGGYPFYPTTQQQLYALKFAGYEFFYSRYPTGTPDNQKPIYAAALNIPRVISLFASGPGSLNLLWKVEGLQPGEEVEFIVVPPQDQFPTPEEIDALPAPLITDELPAIASPSPVPALQPAARVEEETQAVRITPAQQDYVLPAVLVLLVLLLGYWWLGRKKRPGL